MYQVFVCLPCSDDEYEASDFGGLMIFFQHQSHADTIFVTTNVLDGSTPDDLLIRHEAEIVLRSTKYLQFSLRCSGSVCIIDWNVGCLI